MSLRKRTSPMPVSASSLTWRTQLLDEALSAGGAQLGPEGVEEARQLIGRVRERTSLAGGRTVVALAGATGSGKSSLFNLLAGDEVSTIGARRPTTSSPTAAIWGESDATELLEWLSVTARHHVDGASGADELDGLVLLDLPDFDSRETSHRAEADRVLERVDVFVWVTDPQKYADARLHEDYLAARRDHETVTVVVLNQVDRLTEEAVQACTTDLAQLVQADGAGRVEVIGTSARTTEGVTELRERLAAAAQARNAAEQRLTGDGRTVARRLHDGVAESEPRIDDADGELVDALSRAAGIPTVLQAVERDYRRSAVAGAGWPFTRWVRAFRPDPLKRFRLGDERAGEAGISPTDVRVALGRSSLPPPGPAARSAVELATRQVGDAAAAPLPVRWSEAVSEAASPAETDLSDSLDQAVMSTSLRTRNPLWWRVLGALQGVLAATAIAGLGWLLVLMVLGWMQLSVDVPTWGPLPVPLLMLAGGLLAGVLLGLVARVLARIGARRRRRTIAARMDEAISAVAHEHIVEPVRAVLARHRQTREQLESAAS